MSNEKRLRHVPVDIIVPTYENEDLTVACFESIKRCTDPAIYRLIWVDNASRDISKVERCLNDVNHVAVRLPSNVGFVGAVNRGIELSNSAYVCLLNNDTVVSSGWLSKLICALQGSEKLGIVGAITAPLPIPNMNSYPKGTSIYYMKKNYDSHHNIRHIEDHAHRRIFPDYTDLESFNRLIEVKFAGVLADCSFVAFLCAVIKREVIEKVGLLDTGYDFGLYDDSDYNMAVRKAGYLTKLLYSTCIYHRGRSTFDMVQEKEHVDVKALLEKNRAYLKQKWGMQNV